jgi:NAD-dependent SIR2 family protein deacetylase
MSENKNQISFLLGAGFSANAGYPIGNQLNELLLKATDLNVVFHSSGQLIPPLNGERQSISPRTSWDFKLDFLIELIQFYNNKIKPFDYEEFYDFLLLQAESDPQVQKLANSHSNSIVAETDLIRGSITILNQLVNYLLKDKDGIKNYENAADFLKPTFDGYTGFLNCVDLLKKENTLHFHTLNHDVYFERLNRTEWFGGVLCDGFEELGSPYYGKLLVEGREHMSRLGYYTGKYSSNLRLYKLHGSLDYVLFHTPDGGSLLPENYIKTKWGIGYSNLYKEVQGKKGLEYFNDWINYHPDFLTGTTSKIQRYQEPTLFKKLFELFKDNLEKSDKLIIIGYGGKDTEVNRILSSHFDYKNKKVVIVDPYPNKQLIDLASMLNTKLVSTDLNDLRIEEL